MDSRVVSAAHAGRASRHGPRRAREQASSTPNPSTVLTKATLRAAELLGMSDGHLGKVIGISGATMSRIRSTNRTIDPGTKEGELALIFLRMYRSLSALLGDPASCRAWFDADNEHLGGTPAELVRSVEGLVRAAGYLEAMRGKV